MDNTEVANQIVDVLNRALKKDPQAINWLFDFRVACNKALADDPTIMVREEKGGCSLGVLGLLNGILGEKSEGVGLIFCEVEDRPDGEMDIVRFFVGT